MNQHTMAMDPLEKDHLRKKMALRMQVFSAGATSLPCISSHYYEEPHACELCEQVHTHDIIVIKNRANKLMRAGSTCLREMIRFQVVDIEELPKWLDKISGLRAEHEKRKQEQQILREEERKRLEKKVIIRKKPAERL